VTLIVGARSRPLTLALVALLLACRPSPADGPNPTPAGPAAVSPFASATESVRATPTPGPSALPARAVFVIVMENMPLSVALRGSYIAGLADRYGLATNYHAVGNPSLPNYLALTSGDTYGIDDNDYHALPAGGIGQQLSAAGVTWRAYMEGMGTDCRVSTDRYAVKHNPFAYYGDGCPPNVVPFTSLATDLAGAVPRFTWITPDQCHDGHDCGLGQADSWLSEMVPLITKTAAWRSDGVLFIVWDEGTGPLSEQIPLLVVTPHGGPLRSAVRYDHYSLLATIETLLGVGRLGHAVDAPVIRDLVPGL
jgi:phospholipase C